MYFSNTLVLILAQHLFIFLPRIKMSTFIDILFYSIGIQLKCYIKWLKILVSLKDMYGIFLQMFLLSNQERHGRILIQNITFDFACLYQQKLSFSLNRLFPVFFFRNPLIKFQIYFPSQNNGHMLLMMMVLISNNTRL